MPEAPQRIQLRRTAGWRMPEGAVKVDRTTRWGNPWRIEEMRFSADAHPNFDAEHPWRVTGLGYTLISAAFATEAEAREFSISRFRFCLERGLLRVGIPDVRGELRGLPLACWCRLDQLCHADVLLEIANDGLPPWP
jgi:hypothetical protein